MNTSPASAAAAASAAIPSTPAPNAPRPRSAANLPGLDYAQEARRLGAPIVPIIDSHMHVYGRDAARIFKDVMSRFGVSRVYAMSRLADADHLRGLFGDSLRFIAFPEFSHKDRVYAHGPGYLDAIRAWHGHGARMVKFWCAPRGLDLGRMAGEPLLLTLRSPYRRAQMDLAASLGMMFMCHIADPDTWFSTKYSDASQYGTKASHYEALEELADEYRVPWQIAHMGGWPEDLDFLTGLLTRHPNIILDASATKWIVREISRHRREDVIAFLQRFSGRIMFGSDIVVSDEHLMPAKSGAPMGDLASSPEEAFDLYASRYWALRTLWETDYRGPSNIADPDLAMVEPGRFGPMDSPALNGLSLPPDLLRVFYRDAAAARLDGWYDGHAET